MTDKKYGRQDAFAGCHPLVNFLFFTLVLVFSMFLMHPLCLIISFSCAAVYALRLGKGKSFGFVLPVMILTALLNPLLTHAGMTILAWLPDGNPLTLESIFYGLAAAVMLGTVVLWFSCANCVMTTDKFVYLFGRMIPALSLVLSMALRFVPRFQTQMRIVRESQQAIGRNPSGKNPAAKIRSGVRIFSIMMTWSFENAIETSDSMRSRGYGLPGRTAFSIYRFDRRDRAALCCLVFCGTVLTAGWAGGSVSSRYYPSADFKSLTPSSAGFLAVYLFLCLLPVLMDLGAMVSWRILQEGGKNDG